MVDSTVKATGKLEKGIIATPIGRFPKDADRPFRFQQWYAVRGQPDASGFQGEGTRAGPGKADPYDYGFDEMPI